MTTQPNYSEQAEVLVDERTTGDRFENAIRTFGIVAACEWFGHAPDSEFTAETKRVLAQRSSAKSAEVLRQAWASDEARRNRAIGLWVAEAGVCEGCNGHGMVGGLRQDGYHSEECPFCHGSGHEAPVARPVSANEFKWEAS